MKLSGVLLVALLLPLAACEGSPSGGSAPSYFVASLEGAVTEEYRGTGQFSYGEYDSGLKTSTVYSQGEGDFAENRFWVSEFGTGRFARGSHTITALREVEYGSSATRALVATYSRDGTLYHSESGTLEITHASRDRLEGRFTLVAAERCWGIQSCTEEHVFNHPPQAEAPRITIEGSFSAAPYNPYVVSNPPR